MKGVIASRYQAIVEEHGGEYSDLTVLQSAAGWYIGTIFNNTAGWSEPGSRESQYFVSEEAAQQALDNVDWIQRENP